MGKPYSKELDSLHQTYEWANTTPVDRVVDSLRTLTDTPLIAVGSGGSYSLAHIARQLHQFHFGCIADATTPFQFANTPLWLRNTGILLPTAGGRNPDVLGVFNHLVKNEPKKLIVVCGSHNSPLSHACDQHRFADLHEFVPPTGKDGFLAVNSLMAFAVILHRSYAAISQSPQPLPSSFSELIDNPDLLLSEKIDDICSPLWARRTLIVLHGPTAAPAAVDLESKFTEAALGHVQLADYRHFAHGRHHWLAKHESNSAILAMTCNDDDLIAEKSLKLIPKSVPIVRLHVSSSGPIAGLRLMAQSFYLAASAGRARKIDPGRPGIPRFGSQLYHLNAYPQARFSKEQITTNEQVAIERKAGVSIHTLKRQKILSQWRESYQQVCTSLESSFYGAVVLDYDGTLCNESNRTAPLPNDMADEFSRLIRAGISIGIATGRGQSVRRSLQTSLDKSLWKHIIIGYYNGGVIGKLSDNSTPNSSALPTATLKSISKRLHLDCMLTSIGQITLRPMQITIEPMLGTSLSALWDYVSTILAINPQKGIRILRSGHSIDIIPNSVSKQSVVSKLRPSLKTRCEILCIGDRGRWPGNDFELLSNPFALSSFETSTDQKTGWNLAPAGYRGHQATLWYLQNLTKSSNGVRLQLRYDKDA